MFQFFHLCDHRFNDSGRDESEHEITVVNSGKATDVVVNGATLLEIHDVFAIDYDPLKKTVPFVYDNNQKTQTYEDTDEEDGYYDDADSYYIDYEQHFEKGSKISNALPHDYYQPFLHNRIKWNVKPPKKYIVKATVLFADGQYKTYTINDCPKCQGKGWFVDIVDNKGVFTRDKGLIKVTQRFIKDLLTEVNTNLLDTLYGTTVRQTIGNTRKDDELLFDEIRMIISEVEDKYISRQAERINELNPSEILETARCTNIFRPKQNPMAIVVELEIRTGN